MKIGKPLKPTYTCKKCGAVQETATHIKSFSKGTILAGHCLVCEQLTQFIYILKL